MIFFDKADFILRSFGIVILTYLEIMVLQLLGLEVYLLAHGYSFEEIPAQVTDAIRLQLWFNAFVLGSLYHALKLATKWFIKITSTVEVTHEATP